MSVNPNAPVMGRIHSFESCGMVDGPGLRFVAFLQGCALRCLFCHNPDSWKTSGGREMSAVDVIREAYKYKAWMDSSGGGMTLSGGDALQQSDFALDIMQRARRKGMHTALDTSGFGSLSRIKPCLDEADLVILDLKSANPQLHKKLTGVDLSIVLKTLDYLVQSGKALWIRHVVVPGLTDVEEDIDRLIEIVKDIPNLKRFEFLPFHKMGEEKWKAEGLDYTLTDTPIPQAEYMAGLTAKLKKAGIPGPSS